MIETRIAPLTAYQKATTIHIAVSQSIVQFKNLVCHLTQFCWSTDKALIAII